jgi:hypothetical protein
MSTSARPRATFGTAKKNVPGVLFRAKAMYDALVAAAATFVSPTILMATFLALITALADSQRDARATKAVGSTRLRNTKRDAVWTAMETLRAYVQSMADTLNAESAASLIELAGLVVAATALHAKAVLTATLTTTPGTVHLDANRTLLVGPADARKRATFFWQMSADGGLTWRDLRATPYTTTDVTGLALMSTYTFRVSVRVGKTEGAWSQAVSLVVH